MSGRRFFLRMLLIPLLMALSYLGGALAPPLFATGAGAPEAQSLTPAQSAAIHAGTQLLLSDDADGSLYLPLIQR